MPSKHPIELFCSIGDKVEALSDFEQVETDKDVVTIAKGDIYEAVNRIEWGWELRLVNGSGTRHLRVLNSDMASYFRKS